MSYRRTPMGFVWSTMWRKARAARSGRRASGHAPMTSVARLAALRALGGLAPLAVDALTARELGDSLENCRDARNSHMALWRAWRAHVLAGGSRTWAEFDAFPPCPERVVAMQALAAARRAGAPHDHTLPRFAADLLVRWGQA